MSIMLSHLFLFQIHWNLDKRVTLHFNLQFLIEIYEVVDNHAFDAGKL